MYMRASDDEKLDALFRAFREACPSPEASPSFMPGLWQRIEARHSFFSPFWFLSPFFGRAAGAFVTAALALSFALGIFLSPSSSPAYDTQSYVETLENQDNSVAALFEPVHMEVR
jgi:hypothetical protein